MIKKGIGIIVNLMVGVAFGFICGYVGVSFIDKLLPQQANVGEFFIWFGVLIIFLVAGLVFHMIIHETGHLIMGKISGYSFVSFRIFNTMFIKENNKLIRKKFNIVGTSGQCLMSPPELVNDTFPYVLYNLGGSLMNFIVSAVCFVLYLFCSRISTLGSTVFVLLAIIGVGISIVNIVPLKISGIANDGYNALTLGKNKLARHAFWLQLRVNAFITKGCRYRDIPDEWFSLIENGDLNDAIVAGAAIIRFNYLIDRHDFKEGKAFAERLLNTADKMLEVHKNELRCELLFLELISECRKAEIDRLYTKQLKKYIKATSSYVARQRLLYAYAGLVLNDNTEAIRALERFNNACSSYPNAGEIAGEHEMIKLIDDVADKRMRATL